MDKTYIGIDPGLSGAVSIIHYTDNIDVFDTPTTEIKSGKKTKNVYRVSDMVNIISDYKHATAIIEKQQSMPGQGVSSMFSIGYGYGLWLGILSALKISYIEITPQSWKKEMMAGMGKEKKASCYKVQQMFPDIEVFTKRGRALDGRADAILIAEYGRRKNM